MAKKRRRRSFPEPREKRTQIPEPTQSLQADDSVGGIFGYFREHGVRETIESIVIAIVLALTFRAFAVEAFIIPTGSMAPSLQGEHKHLECEACGYSYRVGASCETSERIKVVGTFCPICQHETRIRDSVPDHATNTGDRILVNKFIYDFSEPERFDVIVFKNPNNAKQNYIKRLIGLPGDNIAIEGGDIYLMFPNASGGWDSKIARKPSRKLRHILQTVDDTDYLPTAMKEVGWPDRWQDFSGKGDWEKIVQNEKPHFILKKTSSPSWLRYRHFRPYKTDWNSIGNHQLPDRFKNGHLPLGRLIGDHYAYNDSRKSGRSVAGVDPGLHWVGDIGIESWVKLDSETGKLLLDLVEGGAHLTCEIDVATGNATLRSSDPTIQFQTSDGTPVEQPTAQTPLRGAGSHHIEYVNADDQIHLWVDGRLITFDAPYYVRTSPVLPRYSPEDPGDAEPAGIGGIDLDLQVDRLKIVRDIYYTSVKGSNNWLSNESNSDPQRILELYRHPEHWSAPESIAFLKQLRQHRTQPMFQLAKGSTRDLDQFLPMGDNSPQSLDGRVWNGPHYVERNLLIGRALYIFWPHTLNKPIKYFPNFKEMGFIR